MKAADLYRLMESPALLTEDTLQQLKQIVDEFPYFQIARMLYLKNLAVLNDIRFGAELKKMAIYVPDRRKLFTLIEGERFGLQLQSAKKENPTREDAFSLIDAFLSNREEEEPKADASLLFQPSVSSDYIYWSLTKENGQVEEKEEEVRLQHHDLIDSFIKNYLPKYQQNAFVYFDPPYFGKGKQLYLNFFSYDDHIRIERIINSRVNCDWVITYDDVKEIANIYKNHTLMRFDLNYSAGVKRKASEIIIFSNNNMIPSKECLEKNNVCINLR